MVLLAQWDLDPLASGEARRDCHLIYRDSVDLDPLASGEARQLRWKTVQMFNLFRSTSLRRG